MAVSSNFPTFAKAGRRAYAGVASWGRTRTSQADAAALAVLGICMAHWCWSLVLVGPSFTNFPFAADGQLPEALIAEAIGFLTILAICRSCGCRVTVKAFGFAVPVFYIAALFLTAWDRVPDQFDAVPLYVSLAGAREDLRHTEEQLGQVKDSLAFIEERSSPEFIGKVGRAEYLTLRWVDPVQENWNVVLMTRDLKFAQASWTYYAPKLKRLLQMESVDYSNQVEQQRQWIARWTFARRLAGTAGMVAISCGALLIGCIIALSIGALLAKVARLCSRGNRPHQAL